MDKNLPLDPILGQSNLVRTNTSYLFVIQFSIILPCVPTRLELSPPFRFPDQRFILITHFSNACHKELISIPKHKFTILADHTVLRRLGSVVGIATGYGLDGPGIKSRWGRDFLHLSRPALGPTQPPAQWVPGLSRGVKGSWGVTLTPHPLLVQWS